MSAADVRFSQRIRLEWLDYAANLSLAGCPKDEMAAKLNERLYETLSVGSDSPRGSRAKTIAILTGVWAHRSDRLQLLRGDGLALLRRLPEADRMLVHWCMCMATYPFFGTVAGIVGRLVRLQGTVAAVQAQRRIRERLGERQTVSRAARRLLRTFVDWGALMDTADNGVYRAAAARRVSDAALVLWAIKAMLTSEEDRLRTTASLLQGPQLFPFLVAPPAVRELEAHAAFEVAHCGADREPLIGLASAAGGSRLPAAARR